MGVDADNDAKISMESQHPVHSLTERTSIPGPSDAAARL
jgi:hypothetical protein